MKKIAVIDNYDSFTYNLVHLLRKHDVQVNVFRNDKFNIEDLNEFDKILLSPGPGVPSQAGLLMEVIREYHSKKPILGICLGEQAIGEFFSGKLINLKQVHHGIQSKVDIIQKDYIFNNMDTTIEVGRYHSWVVDAETLPSSLEITALSQEGQIMALRHKHFDVRGIQFHPESVLTPQGGIIISNWIKGQ